MKISIIKVLTAQTGGAEKTFTPLGLTDGVAKWAEKSSGIPVAFPTLTYSLRKTSPAAKAYKLSSRLSIPVLEQTSPSTATGIQPAPTVAYTAFVALDIVLPERSTAEDRKLLHSYLTSLIADAVFKNGIETLETVY